MLKSVVVLCVSAADQTRQMAQQMSMQGAGGGMGAKQPNMNQVFKVRMGLNAHEIVRACVCEHVCVNVHMFEDACMVCVFVEYVRTRVSESVCM